MTCRCSMASLLCALVVAASATQTAASDPAAGTSPRRAPEKFQSVDTSRLMGSPAPLPLEAVARFSNLSFERPVELTSAGDGSGRLFVVEQQGVVRVFQNDDAVQQSEVFLDLREVVSRVGNEEGLLGLAFHPDYESNGELFVYYSVDPPASIVSRFRVSKNNPNRVDRQSEEQLMKIDQPYRNHNGGSIRFGPDGYLYIGLGDGGAANDPHFNAQNLSTLLGSILRIDVDRNSGGLPYAIPPDNPFADRPDARGEIWAYGIRNAWRIAFDRETGQLWTGDVGQNRFEEIDRIDRGGNYGWNIREGHHDFKTNTAEKPHGLIDPVVEYFRHQGVSVTGGMVYRGEQLADYQGHYFYADYVSGNVWAIPADAADADSARRVAETGLKIAAFGEDADGEMYLCCFDGIHQLRPRAADANQASGKFPRKLSETELFKSVREHVPADGLIPYEVNVPFWSDYAVKDRYIALPEQGKVKFVEEGQWDFPVGTVFVKTFWMHQDRTKLADPMRLETRLLVHAPHGWQAYTYLYDDDYSDAQLLEGSALERLAIKTDGGEVTQPYYIPSRTECFACHTQAEKFVLGLTTRQMNRRVQLAGDEVDQIGLLERLGVFSESVGATDNMERFPEWGFGNYAACSESEQNSLAPPEGPPGDLARAWLDVNCAMCHRPEGIASGGIDMRYHTPLAEMRLLDRKPSEGRLTPPAGRLIKPGDPRLSELLLRAGQRGVRQMPPVATNLVSERALAVLEAWIEELE